MLPPKVKAPPTLEWNDSVFGMNLKESTKLLKKEYKWLPTAFKVSYYGGYLSPRGMFFDNKAVNYEDATLTRGYFWVPDEKRDRWTLQDWALYKGWIKVDWWQSYGAPQINFSPHIYRRLILTIYPDSGMLENPHFMLRLLHMIRFYETLFDEKLVYQINCVNFENLDDPSLPVKSYRERKRRVFSAYAVDLYLQLLRQRVYNDGQEFLD